MCKGVLAAGGKFTARSASCGPSMRPEMRLQARFGRLFRDAVDQSRLRIGLLLMFVLHEINLDHTLRNTVLTKRPAHTHTPGSLVPQPPSSFLPFLSRTLYAFTSQSHLLVLAALTNFAILRSSRDAVPEIDL